MVPPADRHGCDQVLWNLVDRLKDDEVYPFKFEGNSQVLDHIFVNELLRPIAEFDIVHVNVDYPRVDNSVASDHEPLVVRFNFRKLRNLEDKWEDDENGPEECESDS